MIQKEVSEIRKTVRFTDCSIHKIAGCYVDTDKQMHIISHEQFLCLPEEDQHKYFDLIKKGMSGKIGKNLLNMEFPDEAADKRDSLLSLVKSELKQENILENYFSLIKDNYPYPDNYYIMVAYGVYDVPGQTEDGITMEDASDEIYSFTLTLLCPMKPSKAGLSYNFQDNSLENAARNLMVEPPIHSFLYPAFNNRSTDIHSMLFYTKKTEDVDDDFINSLFGCRKPTTAKKQQQIFIDAVSTIEELTFDDVKEICTTISAKEEELKEQSGVEPMTPRETVNLIASSGIDEAKLEPFKKTVEKLADEGESIMATNIIGNSNKLRIKSGITEVTLPMESAHSVQVKNIDGINCLVIEINDELLVNGMKVNNYKF